jgi:hypothetical protein
MLAFSPPVCSRFTSTGYPLGEWVVAQAEIYADLGKQLIIRFSGVKTLKDEAARQQWLDGIYAALFNTQIVVGIHWDEVKKYPAQLIAICFL